jgi:DNA-3-methyladenine glycosylase
VEARRLDKDFYRKDVLEVAPALLGKKLILASPEGSLSSFTITETEAYRGEEDRACHASKGMTRRTRIMYEDGGHVYMYLIYGMYWMFNVVCGIEGTAQAVLVRGLREVTGPGRLTRMLALGEQYYGEDLTRSSRLWIEDHGDAPSFLTGPRVGIDYAGSPWKEKPWRYVMDI